MTYRLHCFCQSGNSYKVALALRCLDQPWTPVFVDFMHGATRSDDWRREVNEMGEAPVLEDGVLRLTQSGAILSHLADKHGRFAGRNESERQEILRWLFFDNHKFTSYLASYRFMNAFAAGPPDPAVMSWLKSRIDSAFDIVDKHLRTRPFVVGDEPTIADFSMCGYLYYPEEESGLLIRQRFDAISGWLDRICALKGWADPYDILPGERIAPRR